MDRGRRLSGFFFFFNSNEKGVVDIYFRASCRTIYLVYAPASHASGDLFFLQCTHTRTGWRSRRVVG